MNQPLACVVAGREPRLQGRDAAFRTLRHPIRRCRCSSRHWTARATTISAIAFHPTKGFGWKAVEGHHCLSCREKRLSSEPVTSPTSMRSPKPRSSRTANASSFALPHAGSRPCHQLSLWVNHFAKPTAEDGFDIDPHRIWMASLARRPVTLKASLTVIARFASNFLCCVLLAPHNCSHAYNAEMQSTH